MHRWLFYIYPSSFGVSSLFWTGNEKLQFHFNVSRL